MKYRRRGVVAMLVAISMFVMIGFAVLAIDIGAIYNTRGDLQRTADASAMAGASAYVTNDMMRVRRDTGSIGPIISTITNRSLDIGSRNLTFGLNTMNINPADVTTGWIDIRSGTSSIQSNSIPRDYNAVGVIARRDATVNGELSLFFAGIFGKTSIGITASAVAALDDRFAGINVEAPNGTAIIPFTIHENAYNTQVIEGGDNYTYDSGIVSNGPDDINEIKLFPYPLSGNEEEGNGNFGFLNIGNPSQSAAVEKEQITNGITEDQVLDEFESPDLMFYDDSGNSISYIVGGSPGLEVAIENTIKQKIGDTVGFFLHNYYNEVGANATYRITKLVYGIIIDVKLTGNMNSKFFYIQPTIYAGGDVIIDVDAPSSNGEIGKIVLVR